ncbi:uncharacterized protein [Dermacentor albipictus]|uniref:uncharacterized protein n=1 Tax=Dermacentor albipictus TaxID=60249 RepID=UPI0038FCD237
MECWPGLQQADVATEGPPAAGAVMQVVSRLGHIEPFDEYTSDWLSYKERLTPFLLVNRIPKGGKIRDTGDGGVRQWTTIGVRRVQGIHAGRWTQTCRERPLSPKHKCSGRTFCVNFEVCSAQVTSRGSPKWVRETVLKEAGPKSRWPHPEANSSVIGTCTSC